MAKYMGEDELDRECVVGVLMHEGSKWKTPGEHSGATVCLLWGIAASSCHTVKSCSANLLLCFWCQVPREFVCIQDTCQKPGVSRVHFCTSWGGQAATPAFSQSSCLYVNHTTAFLTTTTTQSQRQCLPCPVTLASNAQTFGSTKQQTGWTAKGNFDPSWWSSNCPGHQTFGNHFSMRPPPTETSACCLPTLQNPQPEDPCCRPLLCPPKIPQNRNPCS